MPLSPGSKLGPYEILDPLGAGGMGEVYRARDTRLGREVAIKVLAAGLSDSPEVRARFEREAKTISTLNHPHICVLHDVGREGDIDFLVMELVEGETLADRLSRGPIALGEGLKIGGQIADALDRAHRAGVVHRDLKPGNVMLTRSGAKLMDFGLARVSGFGGVDRSGVTEQLTQSPTVGRPLTAEGTILGTLQYMSPEQLEGEEADERADLWALGCVLYEMMTGTRAFTGKGQASLIAAIMHTEPARVSEVTPLSPPQLDRLVSACLAKDAAERVQSAHDVRLQLSWISEASTEPSTETGRSADTIGGASGHVPSDATSTRRKKAYGTFRGGWIGSVLLAAAAAMAGAMIVALWPDDRSRPVRSTTPQRYMVSSANLIPSSAPALSPDGSYVVFSAADGTSPHLYRRHLSSLEISPIAGTEEGEAPFFSPDGAWIGFCTMDGVKKVPSGGGAAQVVASYPRPNAGDWSPDGTIYFSPRNGGEDGLTALCRVNANGGEVEVVAKLTPEDGEVEAWLPEVLPDGKTVLVSIVGGGASGLRIVAVRPDGSRRVAIDNAFLARYTTRGYVFYRDPESQAVLAAPFDTDALRVTGPAMPLTDEVDASYCHDVRNETLVYVPAPGAGEGKEIVWVDREGGIQRAADMRAAWSQPRVSPDGDRVVLRKVGTNCELWMLDVARGSLSRIAHEGDNHDAVWSPDGRRIAFERNNPPAMVSLTVRGPRELAVLAAGSDRATPESWGADGSLLAYTINGRGTRSDIWILPMTGSPDPAPFLATQYDENLPAISPDGRWIAYVSNETGDREVFIRPYPDASTAWQVSTNGGSSPVWSREGNELFYANGTQMMVVPVQTQPTLLLGAPQALFDGVFSTARPRDFDVAPDGRFITVRSVGTGSGQHEIHILLNWPQEIARMQGGSGTQ